MSHRLGADHEQTRPTNVAVIGSGNIGTDLMIKIGGQEDTIQRERTVAQAGT